MEFLKNLFKPKASVTGLVFVVEDNPLYAKTLDTFLRNAKGVKEVKLFPVGETCLRELDRHPDLIIMDYFLDSKYYDAETGIEIISRIREKNTTVNIVVLSSQGEIDVVVDAVKKYNCSYVKKDNNAFERLEEIVRELYPA